MSSDIERYFNLKNSPSFYAHADPQRYYQQREYLFDF